MITEDYVSFEVAKLLKEKGFDEYCPKSYFKMDKTLKESGFSEWEKVNEIKAPTQSLAMKWLREVHKIYIDINIRIILEQWAGYNITIYTTNTKDCLLDKVISCKTLKDNMSYEEACEAAIKYCLENLI